MANSPKLRKAGATEPLLKTYHRICREELVGAGVVGASRDEIRRWESDLTERFGAYKEAFERQGSQKAPLLFTGTVGWVFARYLAQEGDPRLAVVITELGSITFRRLAEMVKDLEREYGGV